MNLAWDGRDFSGTKIALICDGQLLTYVRDDDPDIPFPNMIDLPGGGREGDESPFDCVCREVFEEFGLCLQIDDIGLWRVYPFWNDPTKLSHFFIGYLSADEVKCIQFGDEGQSWQMMKIEKYLTNDRAILRLKERLAECLPYVAHARHNRQPPQQSPPSSQA
jgi:8-oxo-dGTP diphosphatase